MFVVLLVTACADRVPEQEDEPEPVPELQAPTVEIFYETGRAHAPGHLSLRCVLRDPDGDLLTASVEWAGWRYDSFRYWERRHADRRSTRAGAGEYQYTCTAVDAGGRTSADTVTISVGENHPPPAGLSVVADGTRFRVSQTAVVDPQGDTVQYTIVIEGPADTTIIGPRIAPIDTLVSLPGGSLWIFSITGDGFAADTTRHRVENNPPTLSQTVDRSGLTFHYRASVVATRSSLTVTRSPNDTVYVGSVPLDTTFAGVTLGDDDGLLKGDYQFVLRGERNAHSRRDAVSDSIIELDPYVDLSGVDATVPAGGQIEVSLPAPTDPNREDSPTYSRAVSLDGRVTVELSGADLTVTAAPDSAEIFGWSWVSEGPTRGWRSPRWKESSSRRPSQLRHSRTRRGSNRDTMT